MANSNQDRKVLTEEAYTSTLSMIIQRDYYPSLTDLQRQSAVLERRIRGDVPGAVEIRRAARKLKNHEEAVAEIEQEDEHDLDCNGIRKKPRPLHQETLTGFHQRVTNEDDHEFNSQQKKQVQSNRERLEKLFRPQEEDDGIKMIEMSESASDQFQAESNDPIIKHPPVRNGLFLPPTPLIAGGKEEEIPIHKRLITNGSPKDSNESELALSMPPPAARETKKAPIVSKHALVEYVPKHSLEKKIEPSQTRFPTKIVPYAASGALLNSNSSRQSSFSSDTEWTTDASTDLDAPLRTIQEERLRREKKNAKDRQSYVAMTPLLVPGASNDSPLITWGTVDSTPLVLSGGEHLEEEENDRERAARKAEQELQRRAKRAKTGKKRSRDKQSGSLTPAAMSLLEKHKRTPSRQRDAFASALRGSYTPKPRSSTSERRTTSKKRSSDHAFNATPLASRKQK